MPQGYYTYRVRVANPTQVQVEKRNDHNDLLNEPEGKFQYKKYRTKIQPLVVAARTGGLAGKQVRELGETLFNSLFDDKLSQDFVELYNQVIHDEKKLLRIELDIDEHILPEVASLPWEFLCVPKSANLGTLWLGAEPNLIFSRRRRQWFLPRRLQLSAGEKLRIGLAIASPDDLGPVVYQTVLADLEKLVQEQGQRFELLPVVQEANPKELDQLLAKEPHIFHFIGHGQFNQLALVKPTKSALWMNADDFADLLNRHRPGVVLLQACEGGALSDEQAFVGVASQVVAQNVPVVVAMQYKVSNGTASLFARHFYERLAEGLPVDAAAQEARREIALQTNMYNSREFATPVLFMRAPDGYLFEQSAKPPVPILDAPLLPAENLRKVLTLLNYHSQRKKFSPFLVKPHNAGAIIISGTDDMAGQSWLFGHLLEKVLGKTTTIPPILIDYADGGTLTKDVAFLWSELATNLKLPRDTSPENILKAICQKDRKRDILIILNNFVNLKSSYLEEIITCFWRPLIVAVRKDCVQPYPWLLLFIIDTCGCLTAVKLDTTELSQLTWQPTDPVQLPPLEHVFPQDEVLTWLTDHTEELFPLQNRLKTPVETDILLQDIWTLTHKGRPELVLREICSLCNIKWSQVQIGWLKL